MNKIPLYSTLFVIGNLTGVFPIVGIEGVYKPDGLNLWLASIQLTPERHMLSALLFLIGAISGVLLGAEIGRRERTAGVVLAMGSLWNAFFIPVPLVLGELVLQNMSIQGSEALLLLAMVADAIYNACLAITMALIARQVWHTHRKIAIAGLLVALPTFLIVGQFHFRWAADLLGIAGPGWLVWWLVFGWSHAFTAEPPEAAVQ